MKKAADTLYPASAQKAPKPRVIDGWREVPGAGWVKIGPISVGGITWGDGRANTAGPQRTADMLYGDKGS